jgi:hypothetical protein
VAEFRRAVERGFDSGEWAAFDRDLDALRDDPEFQKLMEDHFGKPGGTPTPPQPEPPTPSGGGPTD